MQLSKFLILFLLIISCTVHITAEQGNTQRQSNKQKYIKAGIAAGKVVLGFYLLGVVCCQIPVDYSKVTKITVKAMKKSHEFAADGGIGGLKTALLATENIPVEQQCLRAIVSSPWVLYAVKWTSAPLLDTYPIKEVMKVFQTTELELSFRFPSKK